MIREPHRKPKFPNVLGTPVKGRTRTRDWKVYVTTGDDGEVRVSAHSRLRGGSTWIPEPVEQAPTAVLIEVRRRVQEAANV